MAEIFAGLQLSEVLNGADHLAGVAVLVVVPGHDLHLIGVVVDTYDAMYIIYLLDAICNSFS